MFLLSFVGVLYAISYESMVCLDCDVDALSALPPDDTFKKLIVFPRANSGVTDDAAKRAVASHDVATVTIEAHAACVAESLVYRCVRVARYVRERYCTAPDAAPSAVALAPTLDAMSRLHLMLELVDDAAAALRANCIATLVLLGANNDDVALSVELPLLDRLRALGVEVIERDVRREALRPVYLPAKDGTLPMARAAVDDNETPYYFWSQCGQDFVVAQRVFPLSERPPTARARPYFVELAALKGTLHSNTMVLEQRYGWRGLCIEASPPNIYALGAARPLCAVVNAAILSNADVPSTVDFAEIESAIGGVVGDKYDNKPLDGRVKAAPHYRVPTATINEVLRHAGAPRYIDYFSLDIEGAEYEAMRDFNFTHYSFGALTVERPKRPLRDLLHQNGYAEAHLLSFFGEFLFLPRASRAYAVLSNTSFQDLFDLTDAERAIPALRNAHALACARYGLPPCQAHKTKLAFQCPLKDGAWEWTSQESAEVKGKAFELLQAAAAREYKGK